MRSHLALCGPGGGGLEPRGLRARVRRLLCLGALHHGDAHLDSEPGVWLRSFQLLDTEAQAQDPVQEWGEEVEDGAVFGITLRREPVEPGLETPETPTSLGFIQYHTVKVRRLKAATLERLVTHLLDPEHQEADFTRVFLATYRAFTTASALIELLFQSTLGPVVRLWLDEFREDLCEPPQHQALRLLSVHLRHRLRFRRLAQSAETLLKKLQEQNTDREHETHKEHTGPGEGKVKDARQEDGHSFMDFPLKEVAEQLTQLDAGLFVQVVPFHCLGCVWSQRDKKENRGMAPTVRATIAQFNAVTNRVITSLLCNSGLTTPSSSPGASPVTPPPSSSTSSSSGPPSSPGSPRLLHNSVSYRARVIERWIAIAQECRQLRNFSSLRAVLSALQSNPIYRLKKTWAAVSRDSMASFDHLCTTFPDDNCMVTGREILAEGCGGGSVPYLGTFLTVLTMLDTALTDNVQGGLINFEKRRREFDIIAQIRQLQASCSLYSFPVNTPINTWLQEHTLLTDQESYDLSRALEPPVDPCPSSPSSWSHRLLNKKLTSSPGSSISSCSSSHPDLSSCSLAMSPEAASPAPCPGSLRPVYNKQGADSCIVRVSVEYGNNGNIYKSILLTSQDHTPQVIQRALEKHNMETYSCQDFNLYQLMNQDKELQIPEKANVFYAMCTTANYDFVLRQRWKTHCRHLGSSTSPEAQPK
ncbi:Ral guanine nucleotide dissociation stimulator-like 1 [Merluccius polli]|uniref:Ral guanine nucleotide dissociation stimulator-like 1 n=1 Tax=Merluccius polli TaxID=89951 RepID=A0AA47NAA8_MERPO|nr:Ral guanine nucleotide dissociation stimulator-like 1 [Merluccius polli]